MIERAPFPIQEVQTDNEVEFTNRLIVIKSKHLTLFENALLELGIKENLIIILRPVWG